MVILVFTFIAVLVFAPHSKKAKKRTGKPVNVPAIVSLAEIQRQEKEREMAQKAQEREQKAQQARELARMELDHIDAQREQLIALYTVMEAERDATDTTPARRNALTRQLIALDDRLFRLDAKRIKKYAVVNAA